MRPARSPRPRRGSRRTPAPAGAAPPDSAARAAPRRARKVASRRIPRERGESECNAARVSRTSRVKALDTYANRRTKMQSTNATARFSSLAPFQLADRRVDLIGVAGLTTLRYGLVFLLLLWGSFKFFAFEATA